MSETKQEEQNMHYERRFAQVDKEVGGVKKDVGVLQADVRTLNTGQIQLQNSQDKGFSDIKDVLRTASAEPPKLSLAMIVSGVGLLITIGVVGVGAFWAAVLLLANPMAEDIKEHKESHGHGDTNAVLALLKERSTAHSASLTEGMKRADHESATRHEEQEDKIAKLHKNVEVLEKQRLLDAETRGKLLAYHEWLRDDIEANKGDLTAHTTQINHPIGDIKALVKQVADLSRLVDQIDRDGSRGTNLRLRPPAKNE